MHIAKAGCQWRLKDFGPWQTVCFYFRKWKYEGLFEELMHRLRYTVRKIYGREVSLSVGLIDFRSIKTSHYIDMNIEQLRYIISKAQKDYS
jgi:putative transposase